MTGNELISALKKLTDEQRKCDVVLDAEGVYHALSTVEMCKESYEKIGLQPPDGENLIVLSEG